MVKFLGLHEEMHRLVLRQRWIRWSLRNYRHGDYRMSKSGKRCGRHVKLSERLHRAKPIFEARALEEEVPECEF